MGLEKQGHIAQRTSWDLLKNRVGLIFNFRQLRSGDFQFVANKPFNINYRINKPDGFILVNGDQIARIEAKKIEKEWLVVFHLSDGSSHKLSRAWSAKFVKEILGETKSKP